MTAKSLDRKLAAIHADPHGSREFILCDAKDMDMAFGAIHTGQYNSAESPDRKFPYRSREEFTDQIRMIIEQGLVDIVQVKAFGDIELEWVGGDPEEALSALAIDRYDG